MKADPAQVVLYIGKAAPFHDETQELFLLSVLHEMEQNMFTDAEHTIALRDVSIPLCSKGAPQSTKTSVCSVKIMTPQPH